jgi:hypothetical protein
MEETDVFKSVHTLAYLCHKHHLELRQTQTDGWGVYATTKLAKGHVILIPNRRELWQLPTETADVYDICIYYKASDDTLGTENSSAIWLQRQADLISYLNSNKNEPSCEIILSGGNKSYWAVKVIRDVAVDSQLTLAYDLYLEPPTHKFPHSRAQLTLAWNAIRAEFVFRRGCIAVETIKYIANSRAKP